MSADADVLCRPVLVLNRGYHAYAVCTVREALLVVAAGRAEAVDHVDLDTYTTYTWEDWSRLRPAAGDAVVRTVDRAVPAPQVIRMTEYDTTPRRGVTCSRINILKRDKFRCQYCGKKVCGKTVSFDHVVPRGQGGKFEWANIVSCCYNCNQKKACRTPREAGMRLLATPGKPQWEPDFAQHARKITSWHRFVAECYWNVPLEQG